MIRALRISILIFTMTSALVGCRTPPGQSEDGARELRYPLRQKVGNLDPVRAGTAYSGMAVAAIFDRLIDYRYPRVPYELQPALLARMPEVSEDGLIYRFELQRGVRFQDDPAFESTGGQGPEITVEDVFYSLKRMCDTHWSPTGWWLFEGRIRGLDEYKAAQKARQGELIAAGKGKEFSFDYDAPVEGFRKLGDHRFEIELNERYPQFLYVLAMGYASVVPREAIEHYDLEFGTHPVGSGPFMVTEFRRGSWLRLDRNPGYREDYFPHDLNASELALGMGDYAGRRLPLLDRIVLEIFEQDQPMWLKFRSGDLDVSQIPAEYWPTVYHRDHTAKPWVDEAKIGHHALPLLDLIYWGFNMEDPFWGRPEMAAVRTAISYSVDLESRNQAFYNDQNILFQGPIPPGLEGYSSGHRAQDIDRARALLAEAGYPGGEGIPPLQYETSRGSNTKEQAEMLSRQLAQVGLSIDVNFNSFPELDDKLKKKKAQFFGLAWGADYPDAENFLQLFYGPNASPGSNNFNFADATYDSLYDASKTMLPSPERTEIYRQMRSIVIEQTPMIGSMARTREYLWHDRVRNYRPEEVYYSWWKYLDVTQPGETLGALARGGE